jgi:hypothetical protein
VKNTLGQTERRPSRDETRTSARRQKAGGRGQKERKFVQSLFKLFQLDSYFRHAAPVLSSYRGENAIAIHLYYEAGIGSNFLIAAMYGANFCTNRAGAIANSITF